MVDCDFLLTDQQGKVIDIITYVSASLSIVGSLIIIFSYFKFSALRIFPYKLVVCLSIADLFSSIAYYVNFAAGDTEEDKCTNGPGCIVAAIMTQYFDVASFFWTAVIAYNLRAVLLENKGRTVENYERYYHLLSWGIPGVFSVLVGLFDGYGFAGIWCWIKQNEQLLRFLFYYLPLVLILAYVSYTLIVVMRGARETSNEIVIMRRLSMYILVFVFIRIWSILDRLQNVFYDSPSFTLTILHSFFSPLQGFANALVYGCNTVLVRECKWYCYAIRNIEEPVISEQELSPSHIVNT